MYKAKGAPSPEAAAARGVPIPAGSPTLVTGPALVAGPAVVTPLGPAVERTPGAPTPEVAASPIPAVGAGAARAPAATTSGLTAGPVTAAPTTVAGAPRLEALVPAAERLLVPIVEAVAATAPAARPATSGRRLAQVGGGLGQGKLGTWQAPQHRRALLCTPQPEDRALCHASSTKLHLASLRGHASLQGGGGGSGGGRGEKVRTGPRQCLCCRSRTLGVWATSARQTARS